MTAKINNQTKSLRLGLFRKFSTKKFHHIISSALLFIVLGFSSIAYASSAYVDFNDLNDFTNNFSQAGGLVVSSPSGGIDGSGSISTNSLGLATYNNGSFDFSTVGSKIKVSANFKLATDLNDLTAGNQRTWGEIYLVSGANHFPLFSNNSLYVDFKQVYPTGGALQDEIRGGSLQAGGGGSSSEFQDIFTSGTYATGNWYELQTTFENLGSNQIGYHIQVNDYGSDGQTFGGTTTNLYHTTADPFGFTSDTSMYAGFMLSNSNLAFDDFSATLVTVPIPVSLYLFASGLIGLVGVAKRKKA